MAVNLQNLSKQTVCKFPKKKKEKKNYYRKIHLLEALSPCEKLLKAFELQINLLIVQNFSLFHMTDTNIIIIQFIILNILIINS